MVQVQAARAPVQAEVWVEVRDKVEAGWADHLQRGRAEVVSVQNAEQRLLMLPGILVMR